MKGNDKSVTQVSLLNKIEKREAVVGIIGLGYVGLPLAVEFAKKHEISKIDLSSKPERIAANNLYKKLGFKQRETNVYRLKF